MDSTNTITPPASTAIRKFIRVGYDFVAFHQWASAPKSVGYLAHIHRHRFEVRCRIRVDHGDRAVEFHAAQDQLRHTIILVIALAQESPEVEGFISLDGLGLVQMSCEDLAERILTSMRSRTGWDVCEVSVSEDGECTGEACYY